MAKLIGPLHSDGASKQFGKVLIYKTKKNRSFATIYNKPGGRLKFNPSPKQLNQRMLYNLIIARWQTMTDNERNAYTDEAKASNLKMSGWNLFYKRAIKDLPTYLGLQGYWSFNRIDAGKILDLSGNGNDGSLGPSYPDNAPQLVDSLNKKFGKAGSFDGIDDHLDCGNNSSLDFTTEDMSIEVWIKSNDVDGQIIFYGDTTNNWYALSFLGSTITFAIDDGITKTSLPTIGLSLSNNEWHHIVTVRDTQEDKLKIYVNGEYNNEVADGTNSITNPGEHLFIGQKKGGFQRYLGLLDEIKIYKRALPLTEITKHYELIS